MKKTKLSIWLSSENSVSFVLMVGIIFLINNYQTILYNANPQKNDFFTYPYWLLVLLSHIDSFFFGLSTVIIMFQSKQQYVKLTYCCFEGIMIFLNLNQEFVGENSKYYLGIYLAVFSSTTFYFVGTIAYEKTEKISANIVNNHTKTIIKNENPKQSPLGFEMKKSKLTKEVVMKLKKEGKTQKKIAELFNVHRNTISNILNK